MSCISVNTRVLPVGGMSVVIPSTGFVSAKPVPIGDVDTDVENYNAVITTTKVGKVSVNVYLICKTKIGKYLRVTPSEVQYIWVDESIDYNIESNTDWIVQ